MEKQLLFLALFSLISLIRIEAQHKISVQIDGYENDTCVLAYQVGNNTYISKAVYEKDEKGVFVFEGKETLAGGLYSILIKPNNPYFQFILSDAEDQKDLKIYTKITKQPSRELTANLRIENSLDNEVFAKYKAFLGAMMMRANRYKALLNEGKQNKDAEKQEEATNNLKKLDGEVEAYQDKLLKDYPQLLSPKLIIGTKQVKVPASIKSRKAHSKYIRTHHWDNYDWSDSRLIRTPILKNKMDVYLDNYTMQQVDSVSKACQYMLEKALAHENMEVFKFIAVEVLNKYSKPEHVCMDGVYVDIAKKYYCNGQADWLDSTELAGICRDAERLAPLRCGAEAPNIRLKKMDETPITLHEVKAKFTALYFWDPDCANCSKTSDALVPVYSKFKDKGFEVFGVCSKSWKDIEKCKKKIEDKKMDFINTSDEAYPLAVAKKIYDLRTNPYIYLLDENKKILYKHISVTQLENILGYELNKPSNK